MKTIELKPIPSLPGSFLFRHTVDVVGTLVDHRGKEEPYRSTVGVVIRFRKPSALAPLQVHSTYVQLRRRERIKIMRRVSNTMLEQVITIAFHTEYGNDIAQMAMRLNNASI